MNLMKASNQWSTRPVDETFWGIPDALEAAQHIKSQSLTASVPWRHLRAVSDGDELAIVGETSAKSYPTYSAARQLCQRAKVPHQLISRQPAGLAAQNLNWGINEYRDVGDESKDNASLLFYDNDRLVLRATTSEKYERLWNSNFLEFLQENLDEGWRVPPARPSPARRDDPRIRRATESDVLSAKGLLSINVGDLIGPAGVYMSDKDLFVFLWNENAIDGPSGPLNRFVMCWNNEIGTGSWGVCFGYADHVCGNHIIWGAKDVKEIRVRHIGEKATVDGMKRTRLEMREYSNASANEAKALFRRAASFEIGATKEEVIQNVYLFGRKHMIYECQKGLVADAYDRAEQVGRYGDPRTAWAIASGFTEMSQNSQHADERFRLDRTAGRILDMAA